VKVEAIEPHGFCWGVKAAVEKAVRALAEHARPVYCLHELVHNARVVGELERDGMVFVDSLDAVPDGAVVLFSAHGVPPAVRDDAAKEGLRVVDSTCPFVARAHRQLADFARRGVQTVVVGHADHVEGKGLLGEVRECGVVLRAEDVESLGFDPSRPVGVVCQTTLSDRDVSAAMGALRRRYPLLEESAAADICTATRDRQAAVREFVRGGGDGVLVLGSSASSNTLRLVEIAEAEGARAWRAETEAEVDSCDFAGVARLGVTAGASTPEDFFTATVRSLKSRIRSQEEKT
jgi:4-hydroxy-3-methylbut-2-enyl diphosphate reductase